MVDTRRTNRNRPDESPDRDPFDRMSGSRGLRGGEYAARDGSLAGEFAGGVLTNPQGSPPEDAGFAAPYSAHSSGYGALGHRERAHEARPYEPHPHPGSYRGRGPKNYQRSDERIREDVCERLTHDEFIDASNIEVDVKGGEIILSGTVDTRGFRHRAEDIAEMVPGVTHVQNNLRVDNRR
jgi:BON domain